MTDRERRTLAALKNLYDAYYQLPLSIRVKASGSIDKHLMNAQLVMKEYKAEIRGEVETINRKSGVNARFHNW